MNQMESIFKASKLMLLVFLMTSCIKNEQQQKYINHDSVSESVFLDQIDRQIPGWLDEFIVHGAAVAFIENGQVVAAKGYGLADVVNGTKVTATTGFNIGSISKTVTAWGVMRLVEQGRVNLDDPIGKYLTRWQLPSSTYDANSVTVRRLLSHMAGLSLHGFPGYTEAENLPTIEAVLSGNSNVFEGVKIIHEPGFVYKYSGGGYTLLQLLIEEVSGVSFDAYMQTEILNPLNMNDSSFKINAEVIANSSLAYDQYGEETPLVLFTAKAAAGMHTNLSDFSRFAIASLSGGKSNQHTQNVLQPDTVQLMTGLAPGSEKTGLGYQINLVPKTEMTLVGHEGNNKGWNAYFSMDRTSGDGFVVLTNGGSHRNIYYQILCQWVDWKSGISLEDECKKPLPPTLINTYLEYGVSDMLDRYLALKATSQKMYLFDDGVENFFNDFGYRLLNQNKLTEATEVFQFNQQEHTDSYRTYDGLSDAYFKSKDIVNYKKVLKKFLDKVSNSSAQAANQLGGKLVGFGYSLMTIGAFEEAEELLREGYRVRHQFEPTKWTTFNAQSLLGWALLEQGKFEASGSFLRAGYKGLKVYVNSIPSHIREQRLSEALERLIKLYQQVEDEGELSQWQAEKLNSNGLAVQQRLNQHAQEIINETDIHAVSIGLVVNGKNFTAHAGELDPGQANLPNNSTLYHIASITKTLTGILIANAVLDNKLDLDHDIRIYLDGDFPNLDYQGKPILIKHLLTHTSGLGDIDAVMEQGSMADSIQAYTEYNKQKLMMDLASFELNQSPGSKYRYSNIVPNLLAYIIEKAYGKSYLELLEKFVFSKSSMQHTKLSLNDSERLLLANNYEGDKKFGTELPVFLLGAQGDLKSSAADLMKYMEFILKGNDPAVKESFKRLSDKHPLSYFWNIAGAHEDLQYYHYGNALGTISSLVVFPERKMGILIMTNSRTANTIDVVSKHIHQIGWEMK